MFIDELTLNIWAGRGGDGIVSWMHEKGIDHAGPGGGDGGKGGDVYLKAQDGESGHGDCMHGKAGDDMTIELPIGSVITNTETGEQVEVLNTDTIFFLKGGWGGLRTSPLKSLRRCPPPP